MTERCCAACRQVKDRKDLIKITVNHKDGSIIVNPDSLTFKNQVLERKMLLTK